MRQKWCQKYNNFLSLLKRVCVFQGFNFSDSRQIEIHPVSNVPWEVGTYKDWGTPFSMLLLQCSCYIYRCLPAVLRVVNEITDETNSETAVDATGLKAQFDLQSCWHCLTSSHGHQKQLLTFFRLQMLTPIDVAAGLKEMHTARLPTEGLKTICNDALELTMVKISSGEQGTPKAAIHVYQATVL